MRASTNRRIRKLEELARIPAQDIDIGSSRGKLKITGPWQLPVSYTALALSRTYTSPELRRFSAESEGVTIFGVRTLSRPRQEGYELEGTVSIDGKKYRGFTSSQLFETEDKKLVDVAIIHVCIERRTER